MIRSRQDSNLRSKMESDFQSDVLTAQPRLLRYLIVKFKKKQIGQTVKAFCGKWNSNQMMQLCHQLFKKNFPVSSNARLIAGLICVNFCLVFLNESVLKVEGSNGRSSRQRFAEMRIDRRPRSRLPKTTNLTFKIQSKKKCLEGYG